MSATDVLEVLYGQGVRESAVSQHTRPCASLSVAACTDSITAKLPDGPIVIRFTEAPPGFNHGRESAYSIAYTVVANGPSQYALLHGRAAERYGLSDRQAIWCDPPATRDAACPENEPRLSFEPRPGAAGVLKLTDNGLPGRLGIAQLGAAEQANSASGRP